MHRSPESYVEQWTDGVVREVRIDRSARHNALVPDLVTGLREAVTAAHGDGVRVVVLSAAGRNFSTGGDVAEFARREGQERRDYAHHLVSELHQLLLDLIDLPVPVITACQGLCTGGALGLLLASDVVVLGADARLQPWYTHVGFSPDGGWTALLPERVGRGRSLRVQLTNATIGADDAVAWGLASDVAPDPTVRAREIAGVVGQMQPQAVAHTLRLHARDRDEIARRLAEETTAFVQQIGTDEATRGMSEFLRSTRAVP